MQRRKEKKTAAKRTMAIIKEGLKLTFLSIYFGEQMCVADLGVFGGKNTKQNIVQIKMKN